jgi:L-alanine-DL-glutamate epimerase-like enolase superfamily enzyme
MGALLGDVVRTGRPVLRGQRPARHHPEQEVEYLQKLVRQSGARAVKFRVGGRMSRNVDASPAAPRS